jgi:hypothetical protein
MQGMSAYFCLHALLFAFPNSSMAFLYATISDVPLLPQIGVQAGEATRPKLLSFDERGSHP